MTAQIIDGKALAAQVRAEVQAASAELLARAGRPPGIAVVRVGDDPASRVYVTSKEKTARELGFGSWHHHLPESTSQAELLDLVQLPIPRHIDADVVLKAIAPDKDVDGFHPVNAGRLFQGRPGLVPCTPGGVMRMLRSIQLDVTGKVCVVVGRSTIVGRPMGLLLLNASATVVMCHSRSNVEAEVRRADVVIAAVGVPRLIKGEWVKEGAAVIDVGMNRLPDGKLTGDVDFEAARQRAGWITPVPGGVGPMTIAMLMSNTLAAASARHPPR